MKSRIIFLNQHYTATELRDGSLVIQRNRAVGGVRLLGRQAVEYIQAIKTATDASEANALCRAVLAP